MREGNAHIHRSCGGWWGGTLRYTDHVEDGGGELTYIDHVKDGGKEHSDTQVMWSMGKEEWSHTCLYNLQCNISYERLVARTGHTCVYPLSGKKMLIF